MSRFALRQQHVLRAQAAQALLGEQGPALDRALPDALLVEAHRLASLGAYRMAVVMAGAAVDVLVERDGSMAKTPEHKRWRELEPTCVAVRARDEQPSLAVVAEALEVAESLITLQDDAATKERLFKRPLLV